MQISIDYKNVQRDYDAILEKYENLQEELKTKESLIEEIQKKIELLLQTKSFLMKQMLNIRQQKAGLGKSILKQLKSLIIQIRAYSVRLCLTTTTTIICTLYRMAGSHTMQTRQNQTLQTRNLKTV